VGKRRRRRTLAAIVVCLVALALPSTADAAVDSAFGGATTCSQMSAPDLGRYRCPGVVATFDGVTPIDTNLFLPGGEPPAGGWPTIGDYHGWGYTKLGLTPRVRSFLARGYAVFSMSARGWGSSCGPIDLKLLTAACAQGYTRFMDTRYEVRDAQYLIGLLVDDGIADPDRVGAAGASYGGGMAMSQAALRNRIMLPDGTYSPWVSPGGTPIELAGAVPTAPWSDLASALQPNGATLDYVADSPYRGPFGDRRLGIAKQSTVTRVAQTGSNSGRYADPGSDPDADFHNWFPAINAGEPYDGNPLSQHIVDELTSFHSSYYVEASVEPAPSLIWSGWTDDIFPASEAVRFYNRTKDRHPAARVNLFLLDYGHRRARNAAIDTALAQQAEEAWLDHYVKGTGPEPGSGILTLPQVCDGADPSGDVIAAETWAALAPGEVRIRESGSRAISATAPGTAPSSAAFETFTGDGACASTPGDDQLGTASYRSAVPGTGFTLIGSPTIVADFYSPGSSSQIAARLVDLDPSTGDEVLVSRAVWRPDVNTPAQSGIGTGQVFQLQANRWHFAPGHVAKLELMPSDSPYTRTSNGQQGITVRELDLRLPVREEPGALGGFVTAPAEKVLPPGYRLARGYPASPAPRVAACSIAGKGTRGPDRLLGTEQGDRLVGGAGSDRLTGLGGEDCLLGGGGPDRLNGGPGRDDLTGGPAGDRLATRDGVRDVVDCGKGKDTALVDEVDKVRGCERTRRAPRTQAAGSLP
jgi:predicted acyl esterase